MIGEGAAGLKTSHFTIRKMKYDRIMVKQGHSNLGRGYGGR